MGRNESNGEGGISEYLYSSECFLPRYKICCRPLPPGIHGPRIKSCFSPLTPRGIIPLKQQCPILYVEFAVSFLISSLTGWSRSAGGEGGDCVGAPGTRRVGLLLVRQPCLSHTTCMPPSHADVHPSATSLLVSPRAWHACDGRTGRDPEVVRLEVELSTCRAEFAGYVRRAEREEKNMSELLHVAEEQISKLMGQLRRCEEMLKHREAPEQNAQSSAVLTQQLKQAQVCALEMPQVVAATRKLPHSHHSCRLTARPLPTGGATLTLRSALPTLRFSISRYGSQHPPPSTHCHVTPGRGRVVAHHEGRRAHPAGVTHQRCPVSS